MFNINQEYYPNVVNVHRLVSYMSLNKELKTVPHCPTCMMPEFWTTDIENASCVYCWNCRTWPKKSELVWLEKEALIFLISQLPLQYGGSPTKTVYNNQRRRCYNDLKAEELLELDYQI